MVGVPTHGTHYLPFTVLSCGAPVVGARCFGTVNSLATSYRTLSQRKTLSYNYL